MLGSNLIQKPFPAMKKGQMQSKDGKLHGCFLNLTLLNYMAGKGVSTHSASEHHNL